MRQRMTRWALAALLAAAMSIGSVSSASAQFFGDSRERADDKQERPSVTERLREWFEGEREARRQRPTEEERMQARRLRRELLRDLHAAYVAGYMEGYQDAIDDHITLMLKEQQRPQRPRMRDRMGLDQRRMGPRDRMPLRDELRGRFEGRAQRPIGAQPQSISGDILRSKRVELKNTGEEHLVALVETDQGRRRIVDLGPTRNLKDLDLSRGDRISVRGPAARAAGDVPIVVAQELRAGGQRVTIQRGPPKQPDEEKTQPKPDQEKEQQEQEQQKQF